MFQCINSLVRAQWIFFSKFSFFFFFRMHNWCLPLVEGLRTNKNDSSTQLYCMLYAVCCMLCTVSHTLFAHCIKRAPDENLYQNVEISNICPIKPSTSKSAASTWMSPSSKQPCSRPPRHQNLTGCRRLSPLWYANHSPPRGNA